MNPLTTVRNGSRRFLLRLALFCAMGLFVGMFACADAYCDDDDIDFNRDIRPILSTNCLVCHGPDDATREAGLRLDLRDNATSESDSGFRAIVPGDPDDSELIYRIESDDDSIRMPPSESGKTLTEAEQELLRRWIEQGGEYARHWAFVQPLRPTIPLDQRSVRPETSIDAFVLGALDRLELAPEDEASRYLLIRRVAIDLTGLPPTLKEVDAFVNDSSPDAYERMVDRYLASPKFGEKWGAIWLDLARYADSQGYAQDPARTIWRYRDWVIDAINANMPFDQFTIEQIAGDLLERPSESQLIATAFHRNTMTNSEGGTDDEEFRVAAVVDRVNTTMQVWMGLTVGCAQCHTHKYDPISQHEYFQLFDFLNQTADTDHPSDQPHHRSYSIDQLQQLDDLRIRAEALQAKIAARDEERPLETDSDLATEGPLSSKFVRVQSLGDQRFLHLAEVQVLVEGQNVAVDGTATQISTDFGGPPERAIDGNTDGHYSDAMSTSHTANENNPWWEVELPESVSIDEVIVWNRTDSPAVRNRLDRFRVILLDDQRRPVWVAEDSSVPDPSRSFAVPKDWAELDASMRESIVALRSDPEWAVDPESRQLAEVRDQIKAIENAPAVTTPIMQPLPANSQRMTYVHIRGNFRDQGDQVQAAVPNVFPAIPETAPVNRLSFSRWLVARDNPLTARVVVNRYWEHLFGTGLVETSEDFGTQGTLPTHPELLDWLAVDLMENGWDTKRLIRQIVTSSTYRQSSVVTDEKLEADPFNRYLTRGPRFRLSAEEIRDQSLFVAGLLSDKMHGVSVQPPRPNLGLRAAFGGSTDWTTSAGEDRYRRGIYTSWRRTTPYPSMTTFDATSREVCTIRRIRTNTPLQALVTLNDPVYVEAAQAFARRILDLDVASDDQRCEMAFRMVLSRPPSQRELNVLIRTLALAKRQVAMDSEAATALATDPLGPLPPHMDATDAAAWTLMCNVLLNLDEALARP